MIINDVQSNVNQIQETKNKYLESDQDILSDISSVTIDFQDIVSNQLKLFTQNFMKQIPSGQVDNTSTSQVVADLSEVNQELYDRLQADYQLMGDLDPGFLGLGTLGIKDANTSLIIDKNSLSGGYEQFNQFLTQYNASIKSINYEAASIRDTYNTRRTAFNNAIQSVSKNNTAFDVSYHSFEDSLLDNGTAEALTILHLNVHYNANISSMFDQMNSVATDILTDPSQVTTNNLETKLSLTRSNLEFMQNETVTAGLSPSDADLYNAVINATDFLMTSFEKGISEVNNLLQEYNKINDYIQNNLEATEEAFSDIMAVTTTKIIFETNSFRTIADRYLGNLREALNSTILSIFIALSGLVALVFLWIFVILTLNIGRIVNKNIQLADGDLDIDIRKSYSKNEIGLIEKSLDSFVVQIRSILSQLKQTSETLAGISEELAAGAEEASASIGEVSSSVRNFASGSSEQSLMLTKVRDMLINHLDAVEATANRIDETAKFVLRVAKRTNILGLNASIEAAKAGRFGLGFNVVAEEVRNLSNETRNSANDIADSIEDIEHNIQATVQEILNDVTIIKEVAENTADGSQEANVATQEQVHMMNEVSDTSAQLSELSQTLNEMMQKFKI